MSDIVILASRILMSAVFIVYGSLKFYGRLEHHQQPRHQTLHGLGRLGAAAPTWRGYLIAAIELFGGLAILGVGRHCNGGWPSILDHGRDGTRSQSGELL